MNEIVPQINGVTGATFQFVAPVDWAGIGMWLKRLNLMMWFVYSLVSKQERSVITNKFCNLTRQQAQTQKSLPTFRFANSYDSLRVETI